MIFLEPSTLRPHSYEACYRCGRKLARGDVVRLAYVFERGFADARGRHVVLAMSPAGVSPMHETFHVFCKDPQHATRAKLVTPEQPVIVDVNTLTEFDPRESDFACVHCRKPFVRGDRIVDVHRVLGVVRDAETHRPAAAISSNMEFAHEACSAKTGVLS